MMSDSKWETERSFDAETPNSLTLAIDRVRQDLERYSRAIANGGETPSAPGNGVEVWRAARGRDGLDGIEEVFELSAFERDVLAMCAAADLDRSFASLCARCQPELDHGRPTFGLAIAALSDAHYSATTSARPLRRWDLVRLGPGGSHLDRPLRVDERVLNHLIGVPHLDEELRGWVEPVVMDDPPGLELAPSQAAQADAISENLKRAPKNERLPILFLCGPPDESRRALASRVCRAIGLRLHVLHAADIPASAADRDLMARLWTREALLGSSAILIECDDATGPERVPPSSFLDRLHGFTIIAAREPFAIARRRTLRFDVARMTRRESSALWRSEAERRGVGIDDDQASRLAAQFDLSAEAMRSVVGQVADDRANAGAVVGLELESDREHERELWNGCRWHARSRLDGLAERIEPKATWDDLVLDDEPLRMLRAIADQIRSRGKVHDVWGFGSATSRGRGLSALFAGPSGVGKTLAAEVLAGALSLDLCRIDLSQVVNKYIGETEKRLRVLFDAAEAGGALLFFDEADALFGKRSEAKDSRDRYSNIEICYLLQRIEAFQGIAILATNQRQALDQAFLRRLRFIVEFPFPGPAERERMWRAILPAAVVTDALNFADLAKLNVTGGGIRNIALNAVFLAAAADRTLRPYDLLSAARDEYAKSGMILTPAEERALRQGEEEAVGSGQHT